MAEMITYSHGSTRAITIELPNLCPRCHVAIKPEILYAMAYDISRKTKNAAILYKCPACFEPFLVKYLTDSTRSPIKVLETSPKKVISRNFSNRIKEISSNFCKIYMEASVAEQEDLNEISGVGYRKALEFLIKDYAIEKKPGDVEKIKKMSLMQCISKYIDDEDIKTLAERAAWMGNDETHFLRVYGEYDTQEKIKNFIDAIVFFIEKKSVVEEAERIEARK